MRVSMSISAISFGTQLKYKKNYEVQKKDGTPVSKEYADKVVKRNKFIFYAGVLPTAFTGFCAIISEPKNRAKGCLLVQTLMTITGFLATKSNFKNDMFFKEYYPQNFYKWGGFKVVEKNK